MWLILADTEAHKEPFPKERWFCVQNYLPKHRQSEQILNNYSEGQRD
jgi:hypothetical protein